MYCHVACIPVTLAVGCLFSWALGAAIVASRNLCWCLIEVLVFVVVHCCCYCIVVFVCLCVCCCLYVDWCQCRRHQILFCCWFSRCCGCC